MRIKGLRHLKLTAQSWPLSSGSSAEVKDDGAIPSLPHTSSWHSDNFTLLYVHS
jgi:hypothetical protein